MIEIKKVEDLKVLTPEIETTALKHGAVYLLTTPPMSEAAYTQLERHLKDFSSQTGIRFLIVEEGIKFYELVNRSTGEIKPSTLPVLPSAFSAKGLGESVETSPLRKL